MHLAGQPNAKDIVAGHAGSRQGRPDRLLGCYPPDGRVLLAPEWFGCLELILGHADRSYRSVFGNEHGLGGGGRDVDPQYVAHRTIVVGGTCAKLHARVLSKELLPVDSGVNHDV